jgi:hypothetical protein
MTFKEWLEAQGVQVDVAQEDDGGGYECWFVTLPDGTVHDVTSNGEVPEEKQ